MAGQSQILKEQSMISNEQIDELIKYNEQLIKHWHGSDIVSTERAEMYVELLREVLLYRLLMNQAEKNAAELKPNPFYVDFEGGGHGV